MSKVDYGTYLRSGHDNRAGQEQNSRDRRDELHFDVLVYFLLFSKGADR